MKIHQRRCGGGGGGGVSADFGPRVLERQRSLQLTHDRLERDQKSKEFELMITGEEKLREMKGTPPRAHSDLVFLCLVGVS